ncbi:hypothetical protein DFR70_11275 [Nocardia tenerifensis]|uniref:Polyketide cyclase/dehydrase/lipid transport protein n=2 Tax=Nocardia tenerifensis TaxID=228006 RepID=A0A318JYJ2_9NOCA|nr:hypothetical protein DFR70_11275 [Nocardia tenerifensis]
MTADDPAPLLYAADMIEFGSRARRLPAPPFVVWESLTRPRRPGARPWLELLADEVEPRVLASDEPDLVVWSSLWVSRPLDQVRFDLAAVGRGGTLLRFTLLTPVEAPDQSKTGHLRRRVNYLVFGALRLSYGQ